MRIEGIEVVFGESEHRDVRAQQAVQATVDAVESLAPELDQIARLREIVLDMSEPREAFFTGT